MTPATVVIFWPCTRLNFALLTAVSLRKCIHSSRLVLSGKFQAALSLQDCCADLQSVRTAFRTKKRKATSLVCKSVTFEPFS